jgi:hypothetical protein
MRISINRNPTPVFRPSDELEHTSGSIIFLKSKCHEIGLFAYIVIRCIMGWMKPNGMHSNLSLLGFEPLYNSYFLYRFIRLNRLVARAMNQ